MSIISDFSLVPNTTLNWKWGLQVRNDTTMEMD